ncbi:MAG TPA: AbrB/MazE/SpoVT family DNA-binding domain-containing protein [Thermodesulfobacteriaceae bacterium]|nr:AbrB/MazE/SpoVT family DNA-binding domain-containing protein [Thermodesulfobacteriaceae bacterium]
MGVVVKVTRKYQVTLPKEVREVLGIRVGDLLRVRVEGEKIILEPLVPRRRNPVEDMLSLVSEPVDVDAVKLVEESWDEG